MARVRASRPAREGLHVSDLLGCLRKAWWVVNVGPVEESDEFTLITSLGKGHHNMMEAVGEETREFAGLLFTPDEVVGGYDGEDNPTTRVVEYKTTRISSKKTAEDMTSYVDQLGAYCALMGTTRGRLHVFHLVGDYRSTMPVHRCYDLEFEPHELVRWKDELFRRRDIVRGVDDLDDIPLAEHHTWVCKFCKLKGRHCPGGEGEWVGAFPRVVVE